MRPIGGFVITIDRIRQGPAPPCSLDCSRAAQFVFHATFGGLLLFVCKDCGPRCLALILSKAGEAGTPLVTGKWPP
jgi:hypothetical protein